MLYNDTKGSKVFPTGVGMNRIDLIDNLRAKVFPTGVGMNRLASRIPLHVPSVPHGRGDEPQGPSTREATAMCSPRAWG